MMITKEFEMEQLELAIRYFEQKITDALVVREVEEAKEHIDDLNHRYKELLCGDP